MSPMEFAAKIRKDMGDQDAMPLTMSEANTARRAKVRLCLARMAVDIEFSRDGTAIAHKIDYSKRPW